MRLLSYLLLLGCFTLFAPDLFAITFVGGFENNIWTDARNWSPQQVPGAGDEADVPDGKLVNVNGEIAVGTLILGGTLANNADPGSRLTITTGFTLNSGSVQCRLSLLQGCATLWLGNSGIVAEVSNHGEITVSGNIAVDYGIITNESDGVMKLSGDAKLEIIHNPAELQNYGIVKRSGPGGTFQILLGNYTNHPGSETIVEDGELFAASLSNHAPLSISGGATFRTNDMKVYNGTSISGNGTFVSNNNGVYLYNTDPVTVDVAETQLNSQGFKETGPITFNQHITWIAGTFFAQVTFSATCVVDVNTGGSKGITNTTTNHGTINVNDSFGFDFGRLDNYGTMRLNGAFSNGIFHASEGIHNYGLIEKPAGAIGTYNMGVQLFNEADGTLLVAQDELYCSANLFNAGEISVSAGATLRSFFTEARDGGTFAGDGSFIIQNNGIKNVGATPVQLDFEEITLNANVHGTGVIVFTQHVNWTQGSLQSPVTFAAGSVVDLNPGGNHGITGTTTNNGTFNINTNLTISGGQLDNNGLLLLNGAHTFGIFAATPGVFNHGTVKKTAGNDGLFNMGLPLTNHSDGQTIVEEGTLHVASDFNNYGILNVSAGAFFKANKTNVYNGAAFSGGGTYTIQNNGLTANNTVNINMDVATVNWESSLGGAGTITFGGLVNWKNAHLNAPVQIIIAAGATLELSTNGAHSIGGTLSNYGTMNANVGFGGGTLNNHGMLNLAGAITIGGGQLNNHGTIQAEQATVSYFLHNYGTLNVSAGVFTCNFGLINAGAIAVSAGAEMRLEGYHQDNAFEHASSLLGAGQFTLDANLTVNGSVAVNIQQFTLNSLFYGFYGTGTLTFNQNFDWQSGSVDNTVVIATGNTLNLSGAGIKTLNGVLVNDGTVQNDSDLGIGVDAVINNNGTFNLNGDNTLGGFFFGYTGQFNNSGTLNKTSAGTLIFGMLLNNQSGANVNVQNGVMEVARLDNAGALLVAAGATLVIKDGSNLSGGSVAGSGTLRIQENGWHLSATLIINSLQLVLDGNLTGEAGATLEIENAATWMSGDLAVPANVAAGATLDISGNGWLTLSAPLSNAGTLNSTVTLNSNADISNSGTMNLSNSYSGFFGSENDTLRNTGTLNAVADYYAYLYLNVVNEGTISVTSGVLNCNNGLAQHGSLSIAAGAELYLSGMSRFYNGSSLQADGRLTSDGQLTLDNDLTFSGEMFQINGGALFGPGSLTIQSAMTWQYGDLETNVEIAAGATLVIGYDNGGGGGGSKKVKHLTPGVELHPSNSGFTLYNTLTNNGTTTQNAYYYMDGGVFLNNGTLNSEYAGIYKDNNGEGTLTNNGDWHSNNYFGADITVVNEGTLEANYNLEFDNGWTNNGVVSPGPGIAPLYVDQDYANGSELQIEIQDNSGEGYGHDYVEAVNTIQLGGALKVTETGTPFNAQYVIMRCNGGNGCLSGTFVTTDIPADYSIEYTGEEVILTKGTPATISPADTTVCSGALVTLTASAGESYAWSNGETTASIQVYVYYNESYSVSVTDANGVTSVASASLQVYDAPYVYIDPYYTVICAGESATLNAYSYNNETYAWSTGETTQSVVVTPTEYSTYTVTATDANGCTAASNAYVDINGAAVMPEITGVPDSMCQNDTPVSLPTLQDGYTGQWSGPGVTDNTFDPANLSGEQILTFTPDAGQCAATATWTVTVTELTVYYLDSDGDGFGDPENQESACAPIAGYVTDNTDCDDNNAGIYPGAAEVCNELDDDCDGQVDEGVQSTFYADTDGDGYGDAANTTLACTVPAGYVMDNTDCDDNNAGIYPGAAEVCNELDDDCDGQVDEGVQSTFYADADGDGYGDAANTTLACTVPAGYVTDNTDCDDNNAALNPGTPEICNGLDDNCNGVEDEGVQLTFYADADGDGFGNPDVSMLSCGPDEGFVANNQDCNDNNPNAYPGAPEICNNADDDCDGEIDENVQNIFYADADGDGYGNGSISTLACFAPEGYVADNSDCNDNNAAIHPGAMEICNNMDDDCDGQTDENVQNTFYADTDGDGYGDPANTVQDCSLPQGYVVDNTDCDDNNAAIYPGAIEICNNLDDDCDGETDEGDVCDGDNDGFTIAQGDCDDANPAIYPGAPEICNNIDDDCDGETDEGVGIFWYADTDADGYGDANAVLLACEAPEGYVSNHTDCDDANPAIYPGATEICNDLDDDCDGLVDESNLNVSLSAGSIACYGGTTTLAASGAGGVAPYEYSVNDGPFGANPLFTVGAGVHFVTIRDANGCIGTNTIDIGEPEAFLIDPVVITNVACNGGNTGAVNISLVGGVAPYSYLWSNNRTTQDLVNVGANTYTVTATDANGCTATTSATVNPRLKLTLSKTNVICNGGADGTATAHAEGGTPAYTYQWSNGENTETISGLAVGTYTCTVTDETGCTRSRSIHIGQAAAIGISGTVTQVRCNGAADGSIAVNINNGTAPFSFAWSDGATTEDRSGLAPGAYTLSVTDVNGCTRERSFNVNEPSALTLNFNVEDITCHGDADGEITALVTGGVKYGNNHRCRGERYCFDWETGDSSRTISALEPGMYTLSVTDANGCSIVDSVEVEEPAVLDITEVTVTPLPNGKYQLTVNAAGGIPAYKYRRIPGGGYQNSNVFNNVNAGAYDLVVRDRNLCTDTMRVVVGDAGRPDGEERAELLLSLDENNPVQAYPNPATDRFRLATNQEYQSATVMLYNSRGQLITERSFEANADLGEYEVGQYEPGLYLVVVYLDGRRCVKKVMVVK